MSRNMKIIKYLIFYHFQKECDDGFVNLKTHFLHLKFSVNIIYQYFYFLENILPLLLYDENLWKCRGGLPRVPDLKPVDYFVL